MGTLTPNSLRMLMATLTVTLLVFYLFCVAAYRRTPPAHSSLDDAVERGVNVSNGVCTFFDPGLSINDLCDAMATRGQLVQSKGCRHNDCFAQHRDRPCYRQLHLGRSSKSLGKTFAEQVACLPPGYEISSARVVLTAMVLHRLAKRQKSPPDYYFRTIDWTSDGHRVSVGYFGRDLLLVQNQYDDARSGYVGLAFSRKL
jgi:hypothetical protein